MAKKSEHAIYFHLIPFFGSPLQAEALRESALLLQETERRLGGEEHLSVATQTQNRTGVVEVVRQDEGRDGCDFASKIDKNMRKKPLSL